ncbi:alpha/beta fold hydrolase [Symbioplanes lichenis]|uniref:alpha/beta fold hydrolase n=1 Tax=Symbioplanes lichenis TaxID=1629072 RepID=UPI00273922B2|nr:alpha/beta fold hydrolase [Actinoplanes lichenis]
MSTYLLVHGAWHDGRAWDRVVPRLTAAGHRAYAPTLPGHGDRAHLLGPGIGLGTYVEDLVRLIEDEDLTEVILVGHSFAGMTISGVAGRVPERIAHLVFLDAMVPVDGETATDVMPITRTLLDRAAATATPWRIPPLPELPAPYGLFGVTDPDDVAWLRTTLTDEPALCYQQPVRLGGPAAAAIPRTHIHCTGNEPPGITRRPAPAGERLLTLPTGHDCMITMPAELTDLLRKID